MNGKCQKVLGPIFKTGALVAGLVSGYYHRVFAGTCSGAAGTYLCSGGANTATDTTQSISIGAPLTITTSPGFGINTSLNGGDAFYLESVGGLSFTDNNRSSITGEYYGIAAYNSGGGNLVITTNGAVTGGYMGILAQNFVSSDLSITAHDVTGGYIGIAAINFISTGSLSISTSGTVIGGFGDGIAAFNLYGTDLSISANNVSGGYSGIYALNYGSGRLTISTSGTVTGSRADGITAINIYGSATEITVGPESNVRGGMTGIFAYSGYGQPITITVDGRVGTISGSPSDTAIETVGGPTTINLNEGSHTTGSILLDSSLTVSFQKTCNYRTLRAAKIFLALPFVSLFTAHASRIVGGIATPAAWKILPHTPWAWLLIDRIRPSSSIVTSCRAFRSCLISAHSKW